MRSLNVSTLSILALTLGLAACAEKEVEAEDTGDITDTATDTADTTDTGDTQDTADTGDTTDTADTGDTTDTSDTSDTGDTSDTADTADTADTGDTGTPPVNLLANPGFESGVTGSGGWLVFPGDRTNFYAMPTGEVLYNSTESFTALEGTTSLKLYGVWNGSANETPIYQEFVATEGETYTLSAQAWMHRDDPVLAAHTYGTLTLKFFDDSYTYFGGFDSTHFGASDAVDTWTPLSVTATVPAGATKVQACVQLWQCAGDTTGACWDGNGAVYFDSVSLTK